MTMGERIYYLRKAKKMTQEDVAKRLNVAVQTIYKYEKGIVTNIPLDKLEILAKVLDTTTTYITGWSDSASEANIPNVFSFETKKIPLLGKIAAGEPIFAEEDHESFVETGAGIHADFCLKVQGDSMINARINDGDIVFIRKQPSVENGEIAAVIIDNEATLKRVYFYPEDSKLVLSPENPKYAPFVYVGMELQGVRILGKAVAFQSMI
ncbi:MAG: helix-turn-helix domain-containing protein [Clostridia bacterium]|nr:helix-turn-helix domain-containing protein [Clostridia bacterium]